MTKKRKTRKFRRRQPGVAVMLRLRKNLHERLQREAKRGDCSLNAEISMRLATSFEPELTATVRARLARAVSGIVQAEVVAGMAQLRASFRDGPILINERLIALAKDILQQEIAAQIGIAIKRVLEEAKHAQAPGPAAQDGGALPQRGTQALAGGQPARYGGAHATPERFG